MGDRVLHSNSHGKKLEVEENRRNVKLSKNKTSVTACNDSLNAKTLNVKYVSDMCDKCVLIDKHDLCVLNSVAKPLKKTVALKSNNKPRNFTRKIYERVSKTCSWWYPKFTPSGYIWKPKSGKENVNPNLIEIALFIVDSGCSKHMTGNLKLLFNFMEKFLGTVKFRNDQIAPILGYGDLVQGAITIKRVYYVEGLNHNLFSVGQFCDANLEVAFRNEQIDQNDEDVDLAKERELLASLIEKLKCEIDESKNQLKRQDSIEYASEMELECAKVRGDFLSYKMESQKSCIKYTQTIDDLNQTILEMKNKLYAHQDTISIRKKQKDAQIKLYKTREDKELEKVIELENKVNVLDNIVYKTGQSVQTMNMLNNKCQTSFVKLKYLKKAKQANPCLYDIGCYNDNLALMLAPESDEVIHLEKESRSKLRDLIRPFDYNKLNNLYDLFVPQREKSSKQRYFSERSRMIHIHVQNEKRKESFNKQNHFVRETDGCIHSIK
nr:integrase, catalytic region, zinc finger, CCHC-type, peptidase aspartic, catalytic [Tanacetum cinerariifolium]